MEKHTIDFGLFSFLVPCNQKVNLWMCLFRDSPVEFMDFHLDGLFFRLSKESDLLFLLEDETFYLMTKYESRETILLSIDQKSAWAGVPIDGVEVKSNQPFKVDDKTHTYFSSGSAVLKKDNLSRLYFSWLFY